MEQRQEKTRTGGRKKVEKGARGRRREGGSSRVVRGERAGETVEEEAGGKRLRGTGEGSLVGLGRDGRTLFLPPCRALTVQLATNRRVLVIDAENRSGKGE